MTALFTDKDSRLEVRVDEGEYGKTVCIVIEDLEDNQRGACIIITSEEAVELINFLKQRIK